MSWDCYDCYYGYCYDCYHGITMIATIIAVIAERCDNDGDNDSDGDGDGDGRAKY